MQSNHKVILKGKQEKREQSWQGTQRQTETERALQMEEETESHWSKQGMVSPLDPQEEIALQTP